MFDSFRLFYGISAELFSSLQVQENSI